MGNKSIISEAAEIIEENRKSIRPIITVPQHWMIVSAGGGSRTERFSDGEQRVFNPISEAKIDPINVEQICISHSVGLHTIIMYKLKDGSYRLLGSGVQEPFGHLPFTKDQIKKDSIRFYDIDTSILEGKPIRNIYCSFKQTFIITCKSLE
jgi:hypothetical protein